MGKGNNVLLFIAALLFTGFVNLEPFSHEFDNKHSHIYEYDCEYCENHNSFEPLENTVKVSTFSIEKNYLFKIYIHSSLLRKAFLSRAPPKS